MKDFKWEMDSIAKSTISIMTGHNEDIKTQMEAFGEKYRKGKEELSLRIESHRKEFHDNFVSLDRKFFDRLDELAEKIDEHQEKMDQAFHQIYKHFDSKFEKLFKMFDTYVILDCKSIGSQAYFQAPQLPNHHLLGQRKPQKLTKLLHVPRRHLGKWHLLLRTRHLRSWNIPHLPHLLSLLLQKTR